MWCMRYNPSQAKSLLLDPSISADSAKFLTDVGGFLHSGVGKKRHLVMNVLLDMSYPCLRSRVRISLER